MVAAGALALTELALILCGIRIPGVLDFQFQAFAAELLELLEAPRRAGRGPSPQIMTGKIAPER